MSAGYPSGVTRLAGNEISAMLRSMARMTLIFGAERRQRYSDEDRTRILAAASEPGAVIAKAARREDVCTSLVFKWRRRCATVGRRLRGRAADEQHGLAGCDPWQAGQDDGSRHPHLIPSGGGQAPATDRRKRNWRRAVVKLTTVSKCGPSTVVIPATEAFARCWRKIGRSPKNSAVFGFRVQYSAAENSSE